MFLATVFFTVVMEDKKAPYSIRKLGSRRTGRVTSCQREAVNFMDSRLRRCPPDHASVVPYGQAGENARRFPGWPTGRRLPTSFTAQQLNKV